MIQRERIMRTILTTIVMVLLISMVASADLTITVPDILTSDGITSGSFEVFITTDETHTIANHQTRFTLSPINSGISFDSVEETTDHPYVFSSSTGNFFGKITLDEVEGKAFIDVGDMWMDAGAQSLTNGDGLFKVNYTITPGLPPYPIFDLTVSTDPTRTILMDDNNNELAFSVDNGEIQMTQEGPHKLQVKFHQLQGSEGNWATETSTLVLTYGEIGATSGRSDTGVIGDVAIGWGDDKFDATSEGEFGVYTRSGPFETGGDMLVQDARTLDDTGNVLIETYTNQVFSKPGAWIPGETWNEGGVLEFEVLSDDKTFFDDFQIVQKEPGRFLGSARTPDAISLKDLADWYEGQGNLNFGRVGCDWLGEREVDWFIGPFASFDLIPPGGTPWPDFGAPLAVELGTSLIAHTPTPEPSSLVLLIVAGFGACAKRRRFRRIS
jgi:hypothetical protein